MNASAGIIEGYYDGRTDTNRFNNIPFAFPPLGALRFLPPRPLPSFSSPYPATSRKIVDCIQPDRNGGSGPEGQEDCLYLSVTAPNPLPSPTAGLPVIVYVCGGGFEQCYGNDAGSWMRQTQAFIFVNINYRMGVFGFFSIPELSATERKFSYSGNQGLQDQQAALEWVKNNIAAFGGDPNRVTLQGQSAGSISICYHLIMPKSAGLFRAAIMESGGCEGSKPLGSWTLSDQETYLRKYLVDPSTCSAETGDELVTCLQKLDVSDLYDLYIDTPNLPDSYLAHRAFLPVLDGVVVPDTPYALLTSPSRHNNVSVLLGSNAGEMVAWFLNRGPPVNATYPYDYDQSTVDELVGFEAGNNATITAFYNLANFEHFYNTITDYGHVYVIGVSAEAYQCPSRRVAISMARGGAQVWQYSWNYLQASSSSAWTGLAAHGAEQPLIFFDPNRGDAEDAVMAAQIQNYLHRFIALGNPNTADPTIDSVYAKVYGSHTLVNWPQFDPDGSDMTMTTRNGSLDSHFVPLPGVHAEQCEQLWDYAVPHPVVVTRITQCTFNQCNTYGQTGNRCVDNYNSTYYCVCAAPNWVPISHGLACALVASSSSAAATSSSSSSSSSPSTSSSSGSSSTSPTGAPTTSTSSSSSSSSSSSAAVYNMSSSSSSYSSSSSSSGGNGDASGGSCDAWCFVAIAMIVLLSLGFLYMVYRMYAKSQQQKPPAATATQRRVVSPRTSTGQRVPSISSSGTTRVSDGGDTYNVTGEPMVTSPGSTVTSTPSGRVVKKKKKVKKIRVETGAQPLLADDRV